MDFAVGFAARDDDVFMLVAIEADRSCGSRAFQMRSGVDLVAVGAIDHIADGTGDDVSVRGK